MKYIIILFVLFFIFNQANDLSGQFKGEFSIGPEIKFNYFQIYSKSDWNNKPISYAIMDNSPNGKSIGVSVEYNLTNNLGIKSGLFYSNQYQKYLVSYFGGIYDSRIKTSLGYINLPVHLYYYKEIINRSNLYFKGYLGFQLSYSYTYSSEFTQYYVNINNNYKLEYDSIINLIITKPFNSYQKFVDLHQNKIVIKKQKTDYIYNRLVISTIMNFGIEKYYQNIFKFGLGFDIQYGLNKIENYGDKEYWEGNIGQCALSNRCKSHIRSLGFYFTIQYLLNPQSYYN